MTEIKTVKFYTQGAFGNNLFQYFAAEIIKKIYKYDTTIPTQIINVDFYTLINDEQFIKITQEYMRGNIIPIDTTKDILLIGFFQRSEIFIKERDYLLSLFIQENTSYINHRTRISNILKYKSNHTIKPEENDLTLHIRLGDFYDKDKNTSQIYDATYIKNIINSITYNKLYIVCQEPKEDWEREYLKEFTSLNPQIISGNQADDFDFLLNSKKLITSASTMCWIAGFLGKANEVHVLYNSYYGGYESFNQSLAEVISESDDDLTNTEQPKKCKVYYDTEYWLPSSNK